MLTYLVRGIAERIDFICLLFVTEYGHRLNPRKLYLTNRRKVIQGMTNTEYQKVVRNSARIMARRERHSSAPESAKNASDATSIRTKSTTASVHSSSKPFDTESVHSRISLPARVHMPRYAHSVVVVWFCIAMRSVELSNGRVKTYCISK